jgi:hypothetical protein
MCAACGPCGGEEGAYRVLVGRPDGKPGLRLEDNIKIGLKEIGGCGVDWIRLAQDMDKWWALMNMAMNLRVR